MQIFFILVVVGLIYYIVKFSPNKTEGESKATALDNPPKSILPDNTDAHLDSTITQSTDLYFKQLKETVELIQTSNNPETVISRLDFLQDLYLRLSKNSSLLSNWEELSYNFKNVFQNKDTTINSAIKRGFEAELKKANQLKTEKGRIKRMTNFFVQMKNLPDLSPANVTYIENLANENGMELPSLNKTELTKEKLSIGLIAPIEPQKPNCEFTEHELEALHRCSRIFKKDEPLPRYLSYLVEALNKLINEGYFTEPELKTFLTQKLIVEDLKKYLKLHNLPVSGKKETLIHRIIDNIDKETLYEDFKINDYLLINKKGVEVTEKYPWGFYSASKDYNEAKIIYDMFDYEVLKQQPDFACEKIQFLNPYSDYEMPLKNYILVCKKVARQKNLYVKNNPAIFKILFGAEIPEEIFVKLNHLFQALEELSKIKKYSDYKYYEISASSHSCDYCKKRSGKRLLISKAQVGVNYPPFYNCSCKFCHCIAEFISIYDD